MMGWRRYEEDYEEHPKVLALIARCGYEAFYRLGRIHGWCARQSSRGVITRPALRELGVKPRMLTAMLDVVLLERYGDSEYFVHDWPLYNSPTVEERVSYYLGRHPDASANEVCAHVGGARELVLTLVRQYHHANRVGGSKAGTAEPGSVPDGVVRQNRQSGTESGSKSGTHARGPLPLNLNSMPLASSGAGARAPTPDNENAPESDRTARGSLNMEDILKEMPL